MKYFRLSADCFLVEGIRDAAVYDVTRRQIHLLDPAAHALIRRCEDNAPCDPLPGEGLGGLAFLESLQANGLGTFHDRPVHVEKLVLRAPVKWRGFALQPPRFRKVDWSITTLCDWNCAFCPRGADTTVWQACRTCIRRQPSGGSDEAIDATDTLRQLAALGIGGLHIRGGNPLLAWEHLTSILDAAAEYPQLNIVVSTPGTGRPVADVVALYRYRRLRLNVVLTGNTDDGFCGAPLRIGQRELLDELSRRELGLSIAVVLPRDQRSEREAVADFVRRHWNTNPTFAELCPNEGGTGGGCRGPQDDSKRLTAWRSAEDFFFRVQGNTCLHGGFELSADGHVWPCGGIDRECGAVVGGDLRQALINGSLYDMWTLTKDGIDPCRSCALRYACSDCTAAELAGAGSRDARIPYCSFDPAGATRACDGNWSADPGFVSILRIVKDERATHGTSTAD